MLGAGLTAIDGALLFSSVLLVVAVGFYFARQTDAAGYLLAGRGLGSGAIGLSLLATWFAPLVYLGLPATAYREGLKLLVVPLAAWLALPLLLSLVLPIYSGRRLTSIYEYFELRFSVGARRAALLLFVLWRVGWGAALLYIPCRLFLQGAELGGGLTAWLLGLGAAATLITWLGGLKGVVWTDVIQVALMGVGLLAVVAVVSARLESGPAGVLPAAAELGRGVPAQLTPGDGETFWSDPWIVWALLAHLPVVLLALLACDQVTAQRLLAARTLRDARRGAVLFAVGLTAAVPLAVYAGLGLLAFYHQQPDALRPIWLVHAAVDRQTGAPLVDRATGRPYVDLRTDLTRDVDRLIAAGAIVDPNTGEPFTRRGQVIDPLTGRPRIDRIARLRSPPGEVRRRRASGRPEYLLERGEPHLLPWFAMQSMPGGLKGLLLAGLAAALLSTLDSSLLAAATLLVTEFPPRRAGPEGRPADALPAARLWVLLLGAATTGASLWLARGETTLDALLPAAGALGGPLLGGLLLGMCTRRGTSAGAVAGLAAGTLVAAAIGVAPALGFAALPVAPLWGAPAGLIAALAIGYAVSLVAGAVPGKQALFGLTRGVGRPGAQLEVATDEGDPRWR